MTTLMQRGAARLREQLHKPEIAGIWVRYYVGDDSIGIKATKVAPNYVLEGDTGIQLETERPDFLIDPAELNFGGAAFLPLEGHIIAETTGDRVNYKLLSLLGLPVWEYEDANREIIRVHTKAAAN